MNDTHDGIKSAKSLGSFKHQMNKLVIYQSELQCTCMALSFPQELMYPFYSANLFGDFQYHVSSNGIPHPPSGQLVILYFALLDEGFILETSALQSFSGGYLTFSDWFDKPN